MRIAVLGSAGSLPKAPFKNAELEKWAQGKATPPGIQHAQVEGDWDIWGCSPGCWSVSPRFTRFFELHRWEPGAPWLSPEYCQFLRDFRGPVYVGGSVPEIKNAVLYPIDRIEEKFSSYFLTSSLALMIALAIDEIEESRKQSGYDASDDVIGLWGVDMAANEEWAYQKPGCQFFVLEALRRGIGVYLPPESDVMRPMPVYGISEWDHNYIKLTSRAKEMNTSLQEKAKLKLENEMNAAAVQGELHALDYFVKTWVSPYGLPAGIILRHDAGTGLGSGVTSLDTRPTESKVLIADIPKKVKRKGNGAAIADPPPPA
jgi:hypothetical protein